ncbi:hypothetical protein A6770_23750 [Nostoc minutum NIES-26]|uniref:DUF1830 domain-containing protein n=1 Tax=Nostoc minutum NIES-26 TaxID=1844469 RepID=A0A367QXS5_9NOSO|nr:hypothetical protein A6770_23750 [Nostoc minutum NIES-26]
MLNSSPADSSTYILCCYVNVTNQIQVARISNIPGWYFERVVFPGQRLFFEAPQAAQMEFHTHVMASAVLSDRIPCERLQIDCGVDEQLVARHHLLVSSVK